jgi:hypothetical protein
MSTGEARDDGLARADGFAPIESYGVIGDGKSIALVARDGAIDWWGVPAMDSPPVFAAILDPRDGGCFTLEPAVPYRVSRRYLPGTNVLETTFSTRDGAVRVIDSLNQGTNGPLPWAELARDIRPDRGEVPMRWRVAAGTLFHRARPWARLRDAPILHVGDLMLVLVTERAGQPEMGPGEFSGEFVARAGENALLTLVAADQAPLVVPSAAEIRGRRKASEEAWRRWCETVPYHGDDRELVLRSVLALKLLTFSPTGAMAAAATTSLPERVGGDRNYDYRYGWIRDTSFVLDSFIRLGLTQEVQGTLAWMLGCISATAPEIHPFYGLSGHVPDEETELRLRGYRDSSPARGGNRAVGQPQWGCYGDLLECVWLAVDRAGAHLDPSSADLLHTLGNKVCDVWTEPTAGYGSSRTGGTTRSPRPGAGSPWIAWSSWRNEVRWPTATWTAGRPNGPPSAPGWSGTAGPKPGAATPVTLDRTSSTRHCCCWRAPVSSMARIAGSPRRSRPSAPSSPKGRCSTASPAPARSRGPSWPARSGSSTRWSGTGRPARARTLWHELISYVSDLGLLAEEIDPATGAFLGNLPQGLSHLSLLNAAALLDEQRVDDGLEQAE